MNRNPFEHNYFIGYINQVTPQYVKIHFPSSVLLKSFVFKGEQYNGGLVGNYVVIEGEQHGFLGKMLEISLPESERLELSEKSFQNNEFHPTGKVEILLSFDLFNPSEVEKGLNSLPSVGAKVFVCSSNFIKRYFKGFGVKKETTNPPVFNLGCLTYDKSTEIEISQQAIFGRHCAVVGTTGGGKSYTVSKLIEGIIANKGKAILIDATGEYATHDNQTYSATPAILANSAFFHYTNLTIGDLFVLLRPSGQVQAPKLAEAIKSLKILRILETTHASNTNITKEGNDFKVKTKDHIEELIKVDGGTITKTNQLMRPFNRIYDQNIEEIDSLNSDFDIRLLANQIIKECIWDIDKNDHMKWGGRNETHLNNCISLILRTKSLINNPLFDNIFGFKKNKTDKGELIKEIQDFLKGDKNLLRIGFEKVGYDFQAREILANAIGKYLLEKSRRGNFKNKPVVLFIDEAHQYLNRSVKDEFFEMTRLDSFDQIAKECRKHGLFLCLATQMPRDIPQGTLSQMGTFIVHRLINPFDKDAVENACSSANKNSLSFLPVLGAGEAILMGVDFPMPVILKVNKPVVEPNSSTPQFN
jgi:hypothetical protein